MLVSVDTHQGIDFAMTAASFVNKQGKQTRTNRDWEPRAVCRTLLRWYPDLMHPQKVHQDMRDSRQAMEYLACLQDYPASLQDVLLLLARKNGIREATMALDNAIRKNLEKPRREASNRRRERSRAPGETLVRA